jgi:large subunit ribosomal protein L1
MGKIRVNTIGDENLEQKQKDEAKKRQEAKKVTKETAGSEEPVKEQKKKMQKKSESKGKTRSPRYLTSKKITDKNKAYKIADALDLLEQMQKAKFDETVELHINTLEKSVSGNITLPHGTGKQTKVVIFSPSRDAQAADDLLKKIESGKIEFDVLIATPDAMPKLAKVAKILAPRGLMPNPRAGTVTPKPEELAEKYKGGQIAYKTEAKSPIIHVAVGKVSFGKEKLSQNVEAFLNSVEKSKIKTVYLKSTMSPSLKLVI